MSERVAWVETPTPEQVRELMGGGGIYDFGFVAAMARLLMSHPGLAPTFGAHFVQLMFGPGALDRAEREMVAGVTSAAQDCFY